MLEALKKPSEKDIQRNLTAAPVKASPEAALESLRNHVVELAAELQFQQSEQQRCLAESLRVNDATAAANRARAAVEKLHAARAAGENVADEAIDNAEAVLASASVALGKAERASAGSKAAAAAFAAEVATICAKIESMRAEGKALVAQILRGRAARSMEQNRRDLDGYIHGPHAKHFGEMLALQEIAKQHGLGDLGFAAFHEGSNYIEMPATPHTATPYAATFSIDCRAVITAEAKRVADEIATLFV